MVDKGYFGFFGFFQKCRIRNNSTEPRRETETEGDGARNVVKWAVVGYAAPEINIGQNVQGHVYADKLILNSRRNHSATD